MNKTDFARKILHCTHTHWYDVINGKGNLSHHKAVIAASVLLTSVELWLDPNASKEARRAAWRNFNK